MHTSSRFAWSMYVYNNVSACVPVAGAASEGEDAASLISASWRLMRRSVLKRSGIPEFRFRQYLFAAQARLLLRMGRPVDVAERAVKFIPAMVALLEEKERAQQVPQQKQQAAAGQQQQCIRPHFAQVRAAPS